MKVYVDTNILIAASVQAHPHHAQAFDLVSNVRDGLLQGCISTHGLAEFYSVLTRAPFSPRVHPAGPEQSPAVTLYLAGRAVSRGRQRAAGIRPHYLAVIEAVTDHRQWVVLGPKPGSVECCQRLAGGRKANGLKPLAN